MERPVLITRAVVSLITLTIMYVSQVPSGVIVKSIKTPLSSTIFNSVSFTFFAKADF